MFRQMRRSKQIMSQEETVAILERGTSGVLALTGDDDYPYAVPVSYVYDDGKIIIHSASEGLKIEAIKRNHKVSFCVIDEDRIVPEEYTTYFRSAIVFGQARFIEDRDEKKSALIKLAAKYSPGLTEGYTAEAESKIDVVAMIEIKIDHMSGKEAIEFVRAKNK